MAQASFSVCITPGALELQERDGTFPLLFFLNVSVVELGSFTSREDTAQEMSKQNSSPDLMFWPDWKSDFQHLLFTLSLMILL